MRPPRPSVAWPVPASGNRFRDRASPCATRHHGVVPATTRPIRPGRLSPERTVPVGIARPSYVANDGQPSGRTLAPLTDPDPISRLRASCAAARRVLERVGAAVAAGVTTDELDGLRTMRTSPRAAIRARSVTAASRSRSARRSTRWSRTASPTTGRWPMVTSSTATSRSISTACTVTAQRRSSSARSRPATRHLVEVTARCLAAGIAAVRPGGRVARHRSRDSSACASRGLRNREGARGSRHR